MSEFDDHLAKVHEVETRLSRLCPLLDWSIKKPRDEVEFVFGYNSFKDLFPITCNVEVNGIRFNYQRTLDGRILSMSDNQVEWEIGLFLRYLMNKILNWKPESRETVFLTGQEKKVKRTRRARRVPIPDGYDI